MTQKSIQKGIFHESGWSPFGLVRLRCCAWSGSGSSSFGSDSSSQKRVSLCFRTVFRDRHISGFGSWKKTVPTVPAPTSVPGKSVSTVPVPSPSCINVVELYQQSLVNCERRICSPPLWSTRTTKGQKCRHEYGQGQRRPSCGKILPWIVVVDNLLGVIG